VDSEITDLCVGYNFTMLITRNNSLYEVRNEFFPRFGPEVEDKSQKSNFVRKVPLPPIEGENEEGEGATKKTYSVKNVWVSKGKENSVVFIKVNDGSKDLILSQGISFSGLLGQANSQDTSPQFAPLDYNGTSFTNLYVGGCHVLALTEESLLYGWGSN